MRADGKAVGFVAQALYEVEDGIARFEHERLGTPGYVEVFAAGIAVRAFGNADEGDVFKANVGQNLLGDGELPGATVDEDEIRAIGEYGFGIGAVRRSVRLGRVFPQLPRGV